MSRRLLIGILVITALGGVLRLWGVADQPLSTDDSLTVATAVGYVTNGSPGPVMPFHPNLRNVLVAASSAVFGPGLAGTKWWSLLFGTACVPLLALLLYRLTKSETAALIAAGLLAIDPVSVDFSRQAIQEIWTPFFSLAGALLAVDAIGSRSAHRWRWELPLAGAFLGAGVASKFYVIPVLVACVALAAWTAWRDRRRSDAAWAAVSLVGTAFFVFLLTYLPWFRAGHTLGEWVSYQGALLEAMTIHSKPPVNDLRWDEPFWWFIQPFIGWVDLLLAPKIQMSVAVGNPLTWLAVIPAAVYSLRARRHRHADVVMQVLFWTAYLPLVFSGRPVWLLSSVVVVPFALGLVALAVTDLWERRGPVLPAVFLGAAAVAAALLYPAATGHALDVGYLEPLVRHMGDYSGLVSMR